MTNTSALSPSAPAALWEPASGVRVRGTIALVAGRGESGAVYERFGRRISFDGYVVGVFEASAAAEASTWLVAQPAGPYVIAGSDAGAALALTALAEDLFVHGAIVAGTPTEAGSAEAADPADRSACPVHLGVLADDASRTHAAPVPVTPPSRDALSAISVPVLAVHGGADAVAPFDAASDYLSAIPAVEIIETVDGLHDALNDHQHRSVAAAIVLWLERLRSGDVTAPLVRDASQHIGVSA